MEPATGLFWGSYFHLLLNQWLPAPAVKLLTAHCFWRTTNKVTTRWDGLSLSKHSEVHLVSQFCPHSILCRKPWDPYNITVWTGHMDKWKYDMLRGTCCVPILRDYATYLHTKPTRPLQKFDLQPDYQLTCLFSSLWMCSSICSEPHQFCPADNVELFFTSTYSSETRMSSCEDHELSPLSTQSCVSCGTKVWCRWAWDLMCLPWVTCRNSAACSRSADWTGQSMQLLLS